jgi:hypothetical protein
VGHNRCHPSEAHQRMRVWNRRVAAALRYIAARSLPPMRAATSPAALRGGFLLRWSPSGESPSVGGLFVSAAFLLWNQAGSLAVMRYSGARQGICGPWRGAARLRRVRRRRGSYEHAGGLLFDLQARHEARVPALQQGPSAPLPRNLTSATTTARRSELRIRRVLATLSRG